MSLTSNFDSSYYSRFKNKKYELSEKLKGSNMILQRKNKNFRDFQVFDFALLVSHIVVPRWEMATAFVFFF